STLPAARIRSRPGFSRPRTSSPRCAGSSMVWRRTGRRRARPRKRRSASSYPGPRDGSLGTLRAMAKTSALEKSLLAVPRITALLACAACGGAPPILAAVAPTPAAGAGVVRIFVGGDSRDDAAEVLPWAFREAHARGAAAFLFLGD